MCTYVTSYLYGTKMVTVYLNSWFAYYIQSILKKNTTGLRYCGSIPDTLSRMSLGVRLSFFFLINFSFFLNDIVLTSFHGLYHASSSLGFSSLAALNILFSPIRKICESNSLLPLHIQSVMCSTLHSFLMFWFLTLFLLLMLTIFGKVSFL